MCQRCLLEIQSILELSGFQVTIFFIFFIPAKITVFFLIFYGCLAGFFAAMLNIFLTTIPEREMGPKRTGFLENRPGIVLFQLISKFFGVLFIRSVPELAASCQNREM